VPGQQEVFVVPHEVAPNPQCGRRRLERSQPEWAWPNQLPGNAAARHAAVAQAQQQPGGRGLGRQKYYRKGGGYHAAKVRMALGHWGPFPVNGALHPVSDALASFEETRGRFTG